MLKNLEFANDIALLSCRFNDLHEKTERLKKEAARVGLKLNARKGKTLRTDHNKHKRRIVVNGEQVEDVEEYIYQGAIVNKDGGGCGDIRNQL